MARTTTRKAATVTTLDTATQRSVLITAYLDACDSNELTMLSVKEKARDLLRPCVTYDELVATRDALKAAHVERRILTGSTEEAAKDAANMLWSRTVARAKELGVTVPEKPVSADAQAQRAKREAAKDAKKEQAFKAAKAAGASDAVATAMAEMAVDGRKQKTAATPAPSPIVDTQDDELREAFEWITSDASHRTIFLKWFDAVTKASRKAA